MLASYLIAWTKRSGLSLSGTQPFLHRNDLFSGHFLTWIVPGRLLISKSRIEPNSIDSSIGDNPAAARRRNESFGNCDHRAAYSATLKTRLYRDQSQHGRFAT